MQVLELWKTARKVTTKFHAVVETPTKISNYKALLEQLAQIWMARDKQNAIAIRKDKHVPLFVCARNVEMFMSKRSPQNVWIYHPQKTKDHLKYYIFEVDENINLFRTQQV